MGKRPAITVAEIEAKTAAFEKALALFEGERARLVATRTAENVHEVRYAIGLAAKSVKTAHGELFWLLNEISLGVRVEGEVPDDLQERAEKAAEWHE